MSRCPVLLLFGVVLALSLAASGRARAMNADPPLDKTLSPYFFVEEGDPQVDRFPLKSTSVKVTVSGVIADVSVNQTYQNDGQRPIHATYVFPASTRAAVHGMRMKIGGQVIEARVREREQAQREFEAAKRRGKTASLLEQQRPNVFSMRVGNVMPGDTLDVELFYTEMLIPTDGEYEFVFPTVVGPRYSTEAERNFGQADTWLKNPYLREGQMAPSSFHLEATLSAPVPISHMAVPTHKVTQTWPEPKTVKLSLDPSDQRGGSRDFILRYRLTDGAIQSGISLFDGGTRKFFLAVVQPPESITAAQMPPREYVFVVDVSGSMHGFPLNTAKTLLRTLVSGLRPIDRFNVVLFSGGSSVLAPESLPASRANVEAALRRIDGVNAGGGTELGAALIRIFSFDRFQLFFDYRH